MKVPVNVPNPVGQKDMYGDNISNNHRKFERGGTWPALPSPAPAAPKPMRPMRRAPMLVGSPSAASCCTAASLRLRASSSRFRPGTDAKGTRFSIFGPCACVHMPPFH